MQSNQASNSEINTSQMNGPLDLNKKLTNLRVSIISAFPELICDTQNSGDTISGKVNKLLLEYFVQTELSRMSDNSSQAVSNFTDKQIESNNSIASAIVKTYIETPEKNVFPDECLNII